MVKNIYVFIFLFVNTFLFGQHQFVQNKKTSKHRDFNAKLAWQQAQKKSTNPKAQKEIFESMKRGYDIAEKKKEKSVHSLLAKNKAGYPVILFNSDENKGNTPPSPFGNSYCPNSGFNLQNFTNWTGQTGDANAAATWTLAPTWTSGIVTYLIKPINSPLSLGAAGTTLYDTSFNQVVTTNRHNIMNAPIVNNNPANGIVLGYDSLAINPTTNLADIPVVCPTGGGVSVRLGNANTGGETESITYSMPVSSQNALFTYQYAVVLNNPSGGHTSDEQPFFQITLQDQNGNTINSPCAIYNVTTDSAADPKFGFIENTGSTYNGFLDVFYKNWTPVTIDLTPYIGQTITIQFRTSDCSLGGHFGYAYIDASCNSTTSSIVTDMCHGDSIQQVVAPAGFSSYQWSGPNSNIMIPAPKGTDDTLTIINGTVGDTYTVACVSAAGCTTYVQAVLQFSIVKITNTQSTPSCIGGSSGSVSVISTGSPNGNYTYSWINSSGQVVGTTNPKTGLAPGSYTVQVAAPGCGQKDTTVTINIAPPFVQMKTANFCGNATYLTVPAGSSNIQWYSPGGIKIPAPLGNKDTLLAQGTVNNQVYMATYVNSGCTDSMLITLTQISGGTLSHSNIVDVCVGGTNGQVLINLATTATPPYSYAVAGPGYNTTFPVTTNTSIPLTGLAYGNYTVSAFDGSCFYNDNFKIDTLSVPVSITVSPLVLCSNANPSVMTFSYSYAPPVQCQLSTTACTNPQVYTCGPSNTVTPSSFQYPTPYGNNYTKMRAQYIYTASELNAAGITGGNISSIAFNVTNLNGTISSYPDFNISVGCSGQSTFSALSDQTSLITGLTNVYSNPNVNVTTGLNTYNFSQAYAWDGISNLIVDLCFEVPGTYSFTANAQVSCSSTSNYSSLTISSDTDPTCNISATGIYDADPEQMRPVATFGWCNVMATASMYTYSITPGNSVVGNVITTPTTSLQPTSTTHYTLTTTSINGGCLKKDTFTVFITPPFTINMPNPDTLLCNSSSTKTLTATFTDNNGNNVQEEATWSIHNNVTAITNVNNFGLATFNPHLANLGSQYLVITAGGNCQVKDSVLYKVYPFKSAKINLTDSIFCINDPGIQVQATSAGGTWSGTGITSTGFFSPQTAGVTSPFVLIKYIINKGTPCEDSSTAKMTVVNTPTVNFATDTTQGCVPATTIWFSSSVLPLTTGGSYMWYFSDGHTSNTQNTTHVYSLQGTYSPKIVYTDANGCKDSLTRANCITVYPKPEANFYANPATTNILAPHVDFINTTKPVNCTWAWNVAGVDTSVLINTSQNFNEPGNYIVTLYATNQYNCRDTSSLDLIVKGAYALYVPSSFTPNQDGLNELFIPSGFGLSENNIGYKMEIFNRWGQKIFETTDINTGWNGSRNGVALTEDIYVYSIVYVDYQNDTHSVTGQVTLIK